jgi:MYXO-CTERM domain-containing protein
MESDISAVADPSTGVAIYDSNFGGWGEIGGTSASAPMIAAMFTRLGLARTVSQQAGAWPAAHTSAFYDVTSGSNESVGQGGCASSYECVCQAGYDGPTGYGTPNGASLLALGGGIALPSVAITAPASNATVRGTITITASASAAAGTSLATLAIQIDGTQVASGASSPRSFSWDTGAVRNGSHTLTAIATDAAGNQGTATTKVFVFNDFSISILPSSLTSVQGDTVSTAVVTVTAIGSLPSGVALSASGLPQFASYEFSPAQVASGGTSTMSVLAATAAPGIYPVVVTGTGGGLTHTATLTWTIQPAPSGCSSVAPDSALAMLGLALLIHLRSRRRRAGGGLSSGALAAR